MRNDMLKVLCERERIGHRAKGLKTGGRIDPRLDFDDYDFGPSRLSSGRHKQESRCSHLNSRNGGTEYKQFNDNWNPMARWLEKQVGRLWDDVYSEIRSSWDHRSDIGWRFLRYIGWNVEQQIEIIDGVPHSCDRWGRGPTPINGLYVDPATGLLQYHKAEPRTYPAKPITYISCESPLYYYQREDGIWYLYTHRLHDPEEPYRIITYTERISYAYNGSRMVFSDPSPETRQKYGLKKPGDKFIIRYKDVDPEYNKPILVSKQQVDGDGLKKIREHIQRVEIGDKSPHEEVSENYQPLKDPFYIAGTRNEPFGRTGKRI